MIMEYSVVLMIVGLFEALGYYGNLFILPLWSFGHYGHSASTVMLCHARSAGLSATLENVALLSPEKPRSALRFLLDPLSFPFYWIRFLLDTPSSVRAFLYL